jgi:hypothetical protein
MEYVDQRRKRPPTASIIVNLLAPSFCFGLSLLTVYIIRSTVGNAHPDVRVYDAEDGVDSTKPPDR